MPRAPVRIAGLASTLLAATAAVAAEQPVSATSGPLAPGQEEVLVVGKKDKASTEMNKETEQLLGIAGAANDPLQAIYALPGVTFSSGGDGPGGSEPVIRGSAPQDNAYFIDLIPASYLFHLFGNSIFDKHIISSFELYPAAFSSKYGNATGGIIDVTLREPRNDSFTTTLHTSLLTAGALVETGIGENQSLYATYRRSTMDLLLDEEDIDDDEDEGFRIDELPISDDYQLKYSWHLNESNSLSVVAAGAGDTLAATFDENSQEALKDPDFAGPASLEQGFDSQGAVWNWRGSGRELTSVFSHTSENNNLIYGADQHEKTDSDRYLSRFLYKQALNNRHSLSMGLSLEEISYELDFNAKFLACNDLDPECSTVDAEYVSYKDTLDISAHELYVEDRWSISGKHALTLGIHYGSDDYLGDDRIEPRMRFEYQVNDKLSTYLAAGQYSQLPQLREMIEVLGNPKLTAVKSDHFVWGMSQALGGGWRWNADLYYKDMTDIVISAEQDSAAENYSNGAEGRAYGAEFLIRKDLTNRWYGWASLSLAESDRTKTATGEALRFEHDKPVLFNLVWNRQIGKFWTMGLRWTYQSGGRYTPIVDLVPSSSHPDVLEPVYGQLNSEQYPDYHRLDFRAEYTRPKKWGYWKFYADVLNAFGQENISSYEYAPNGKKLIPPPPGYGQSVPVTQEIRDDFFPSIGFEVQFR
jgi:outer membrane receptor for ferrienterochelin and colicin